MEVSGESDIARWYRDGRDFVEMNGEMYFDGVSEVLFVGWADLREELEGMPVGPITTQHCVAPTMV